MLVVNPSKPQAMLSYDVTTRRIDAIHELQLPEVLTEEGFLSIPRHITFPTDNGTAEAYGYYYPPTNKNYVAPSGTLPPLLIQIHGGPTASASLALNLTKQYFTSRGIAILDVNYRGSTGYGTAYRKALYRKWGVYDIEDACAGALHMAKGDGADKVDGSKLLIDGGSAGGYTTLACLTFRDVFKAGASYYGVSDLEALAKETHKFESRYLDQVIGPYPEDAAVYKDRSPINHLASFRTACAFFQGGLDKIVPEDQAESMFNKIKGEGVPCAYVLYPDEGHGFKKSANKQKSLDGELYFYSKTLGFQAADQGIEIPIFNLPVE
jgi:dipeptidyl aminopeptidase/acylaminoacyl peptidase